MQERFKEIRSEVGRKIDGLVRTVLDIQPPLEEVMANFPHKKGCPRSTPLKIGESVKFVPISYAGTMVTSTNFIEVPYKYVECGECKVNARYSA
jgi:hypothetical protein